MSHDTVRSISKSAKGDLFFVACLGANTIAVQTVFFRELFSVFSGNEISIGIVFSTWLFSSATGIVLFSYLNKPVTGVQKNSSFGSFLNNPSLLIFLQIIFAVGGFTVIRAGRLIFNKGVDIGPLGIFAICFLGISFYTIINGYLFGLLFSQKKAISKKVYGLENLGIVCGGVVVFFAVTNLVSNAVILFSACLLLLIFIKKRAVYVPVLLVLLCGVLLTDNKTQQWKNSFIAAKTVSGIEGEITQQVSDIDTSYFLNGKLFKSTMEKPFCEQAVHIPMAERHSVSSVLLIRDIGQKQELKKYPGLTIDVIETEPFFAHGNDKRIAVESYTPKKPYDVIFVSSNIPQTIADNRFFTQSFFKKAKTMISDSGIMTFTLPFSENYLSPYEQKLHDALLSTLRSVWKHVEVFPGFGHTFMASDYALSTTPAITTATTYLSSSIIPGISPDMFHDADSVVNKGLLNTTNKPSALLYSLQTWIEHYGAEVTAVSVVIFLILVLLIVVCVKNKNQTAMGSTGFATGVYSMCILILFQARFGALFADISLFLLSVSFGFFCGSFIGKIRHLDLLIGGWSLISILILLFVPLSPFFFYCFYAGFGVLAGSQFNALSGEKNAASLYASDCLGGAIGMALSTTLCVPLIGILGIVSIVFVIKVFVARIVYSSK